MTQPWVGRKHGNVSHCAHGISYKELCGYCWEPEKMKEQQSSKQSCGHSCMYLKAGVITCALCEIERLRAALNSAVLMVEKLKVFGDDNMQRYDVKPWLEKVRGRFPGLPGPHQFWGLPEETEEK